MGVDADRPEARPIGRPGDLDGLVWSDPGPVPATVELDEDVEWMGRADDRPTECGRALDRVDADAEPESLMQVADATGLRRRCPDGVGEEQVVEPGVGEDLRLADRADREPAGAGGLLECGDPGALVGLGVRPEGDARRIRPGLLRGDVPLEPAEIDDRARRIEVVVGQLRGRDQRVRRGQVRRHRHARHDTVQRGGWGFRHLQ